MSMKPTGSLATASDSEDDGGPTESSYAASPHTGNLIVVTGPSGVGKGTVVERLLKEIPGLVRSVSVTTRQRRQGEVDGVDYFFRTPEAFNEMRHHDQLMEWAEFAGAFYGTPKVWLTEMIHRGEDVLLEIEVQGAKQIRERWPGAILIFLSPPSFEVLKARLVGRATESPEKIDLRLSKALQEMGQRHLFHYEVVNDNVDQAVNNLMHIVYAERARIRNPIQ